MRYRDVQPATNWSSVVRSTLELFSCLQTTHVVIGPQLRPQGVRQIILLMDRHVALNKFRQPVHVATSCFTSVFYKFTYRGVWILI